jgi:hypothetical protein
MPRNAVFRVPQFYDLVKILYKTGTLFCKVIVNVVSFVYER